MSFSRGAELCIVTREQQGTIFIKRMQTTFFVTENGPLC